MANGPLAGLRVIDFSWVGAGSFTTRLLAEHGADVVKVESSTHLDSLRIGPPFAGGVPGVNRSGYFAERNANKRSVTIDLKNPRGVEIVKLLLADADIVANNFRPGVMDSLGLGYDSVRTLNPGVIYLSMSMQGASGPESGYAGYGITIAAMSGMTHLSAQPGCYPVGTGTHYPDHVPNPSHAAFALLAAVRHQRRTGLGQYIEMAQTEPTISCIGPAVMEWTATGTEPVPLGNRHPNWCPHGVFPTLGDDRWIAFAARTEHEWEQLADELGLDALRGLSLPERHARVDEVEQAVRQATSALDGHALMLSLQAARVPAGIVTTAKDIVDDDPQLAARDHWRYLDHAEMGRSVYGRAPFRLSATPGDLDTPAPLLGEHTAAVLHELLGLDAETIAELVNDDVLR